MGGMNATPGQFGERIPSGRRAGADEAPAPDGGRPVLLHACCGPCASHCVPALKADGREPVVFFSNSNLDSREEYDRRLAAARKLADAEGVRLVADPYDPAAWERAVAGFEGEPEGGARCDRCFRHNLGRAAAAAAAGGFGAFSTSLTVSPHKNSRRVFAAGRAAAAETPGAPPFLEADFKKKDGFLDSVRRARALGLYRQSYCGCKYSKAAAAARAKKPVAPEGGFC